MFYKIFYVLFFLKETSHLVSASFSVPEPLASMRVKTSLTHHCPLSLQHSVSYLKKCLLGEHIICHHPIRPNTRFLYPWDFFLLAPSRSCKSPPDYNRLTLEETRNSSQEEQLLPTTHISLGACVPRHGGEVRCCPPEASSLASADFPETLEKAGEEMQMEVCFGLTFFDK